MKIIIQTKDYLLLIDEEADLHTEPIGTVYLHKEDEYEVIETKTKDRILGFLLNGTKIYYKIIAYYPLTKEAKELDLPLFPNPFENKVDIVALAIEIYGDNYHSLDQVEAFKKGYKAAQSKQFSLEDIKSISIAFAEHCKSLELSGNYITNYKELFDDSIEEIGIPSLSTQQLPKEFTPEYYTNGDMIVKNRNGVRELVGTYKY